MVTPVFLTLSLALGALGHDCKRSLVEFHGDDGGGSGGSDDDECSSIRSSFFGTRSTSSSTFNPATSSESTPNTSPPPQSPPQQTISFPPAEPTGSPIKSTTKTSSPPQHTPVSPPADPTPSTNSTLSTTPSSSSSLEQASGFPPADPTPSVSPSVHGSDNAALIAPVLGIVVLLLLVIILLLLLRRRRRRRQAALVTEAKLEQGSPGYTGIDQGSHTPFPLEKDAILTVNHPAPPARAKSRTSRRTGRFRRALLRVQETVRPSQPAQSDACIHPAMSQATQGNLVSVPSPSMQTASDSTSESLADQDPSSASVTSGWSAISLGPVSTVRPGSVFLEGDDQMPMLKDGGGVIQPPTYESLMNSRHP